MNSTQYMVTVFCAFLLLISPVCAQIFLTDGTEVSKDHISGLFSNRTDHLTPSSLQFFYYHDCQSCHQALEYLRSFEKKIRKSR